MTDGPHGNPVAEERDLRWSRLMVAAQAGDARAYDTLLRECLPLLRAICRARLRNPADVEEAVQDTLLTMHRVRATYDPARPFRPWLAAIAERRAIDRGRSLGRTIGREVEIEQAAELASGDRAADLELQARRDAASLRAAVAELTPAQQTALRLTKLGELSLEEASRKSGMTPGALKVATHRAIGALRRRFGTND